MATKSEVLPSGSFDSFTRQQEHNTLCDPIGEENVEPEEKTVDVLQNDCEDNDFPASGNSPTYATNVTKSHTEMSSDEGYLAVKQEVLEQECHDEILKVFVVVTDGRMFGEHIELSGMEQSVNGQQYLYSSLTELSNPETEQQCAATFRDDLLPPDRRRGTSSAARQKYDCEQCGKTFKQHVAFQRHERHHRGESEEFCTVCNIPVDDFPAHAKSVHADVKPFRCTVCDARFNIASSFYKHMRNVHTTSKSHMCDTCGKVFTVQQYLQRHQLTHLPERPHVCRLCSKTYASRTTLNIHLRSHTGERPFMCLICGKKFAAAKYLRLHQITHEAAVDRSSAESQRAGETTESQTWFKQRRKKFACSECDAKYMQRASLRQHMLKHTGDRPYVCMYTDCHASFTQRTKLHCHLAEHAGVKLYVCQVCGAQYSSYMGLWKHRFEHLSEGEEKPHKCLHCEKSFVVAAALRQHMVKHTGERAYGCEQCGKSFTQLSTLRAHARIHSGEKPYSCTICSKRFNHSSHLKRHNAMHAGLKPHACSYCGKTFSLAGNMRQHLKTHAREDPYNELNVASNLVLSSSFCQ